MHLWSNTLTVTLDFLVISRFAFGQVNRSAWKCKTDSFQGYGSHGEKHDCAKAIDSNDTTFWHSEWYPDAAPLPHNLTIYLGKKYNITRVTYLPRQDGSRIGNIGDWKIALSVNNVDWNRFFGSWPDDQQLKTFDFPDPIPARWLTIAAYTEAGNGINRTSAAEFNVFATMLPNRTAAAPQEPTSSKAAQPSEKPDSKDKNPLGTVGTVFTVLGGLAALGTLIWSIVKYCFGNRPSGRTEHVNQPLD
ncbi:MAG: hypothetical protein L6R38_008523 [Xanthoria sp. 2 TBL-2021]|nr:MAG: hypothetical protein L6R38_008523 [Xanthoria sp. 2 TBL-2021]